MGCHCRCGAAFLPLRGVALPLVLSALRWLRSCGALAGSAPAHTHLVARALLALPELARRPPVRQLHESKTTSGMRHNGTAMERIVNATWQCTFPDGNCFTSHGSQEGMPDKMNSCVKEENAGPLTVFMVIDLHCAKMDTRIHCDKLHPHPFDPFYTCTNDPNLIMAQCHLECKDGYPFEKCRFDFDKQGLFNMSDETVDTCILDATCMSPYIEQNQMLCSGHQSSSNFKPHWLNRPLSNRVNASHDIRPPLPPPPSTVLHTLLWCVAIVFLGIGCLVALCHLGALPDLAKLKALVTEDTGSVRRIGSPYRAPPVVFATRELHPLSSGSRA